MATMQISNIVLRDGFPGAPNPNLGIPTDGWDGTTHSCVTSPTYPLGTKIQAYTDNSLCPGYYVMMYGSYVALSAGDDVSGDFSDGLQWCGHCALTTDTGDLTYEIYNYESVDVCSLPMCYLTRCVSTGTMTTICNGGPIALPCASLEGYDMGWFWVGGVCPCKDVTIMKGLADSLGGADQTTDGAVVPGPVYMAFSGTASMFSSADWSSVIDGTIPNSIELPPAYCTRVD